MIRHHASAHSRNRQGPARAKAAAMPYRPGSRAGRAADRSKTMFSVGQRVWLLRDTTRSGIVVECAAGQVYIEQDNGAELDFPEGELTTQPPAQAAAKAHDSRGMAKPDHAMPSRPLTARDITPEHLRVLAAIPARTLQAVAVVFDRKSQAAQPPGRFSALDPAGRLNAIADISAVPYRTMRLYSDRPGELGLIMGKGLADSHKSA
jgi:hypothetical protein